VAQRRPSAARPVAQADTGSPGSPAASSPKAGSSRENRRADAALFEGGVHRARHAHVGGRRETRGGGVDPAVVAAADAELAAGISVQALA